MNKELEEVTQSKYPLDIWTEEESLIRKLAFSNGAKWMQEKMFSEEDLKEMLHYVLCTPKRDGYRINMNDSLIEKTIEKFKKEIR
jgi:hypothetical protein